MPVKKKAAKAVKLDLMPGTTVTIPEWHARSHHALSWCHVHGILPDSEYRKGVKRIDKQIVQAVREVKKKGIKS